MQTHALAKHFPLPGYTRVMELQAYLEFTLLAGFLQKVECGVWHARGQNDLQGAGSSIREAQWVLPFFSFCFGNDVYLFSQWVPLIAVFPRWQKIMATAGLGVLVACGEEATLCEEMPSRLWLGHSCPYDSFLLQSKSIRSKQQLLQDYRHINTQVWYQTLCVLYIFHM